MKFHTAVGNYISGLTCKNLWKITYSSWVNRHVVDLIFCGACGPSKKNITVYAD